MSDDSIYDYLGNLREEQWNIKVDSNWTVKDILAHLVGWENECTKQIPIIWQTKEKPWFVKTNDYAAFNKKSIEEYKNFSPRQLLDEWYEWREELEKAAKKIGEGEMKAEKELFAWYFEGTDFDETGVDHYTEHLNQIKKVLKV